MKAVFLFAVVCVVTVSAPASATGQARNKIRAWSLRMDQTTNKVQPKMAGMVPMLTPAPSQPKAEQEKESKPESK